MTNNRCKLFERAMTARRGPLPLPPPPGVEPGGVPVRWSVVPEPGLPDLRELTREDLFRLVYVPLVAAELTWDYADTICNLAAQQRLGSVRKACRALRQYRAEYIRQRGHVFDDDYLRKERRNAEIVEDNIADILRQFRLYLDDKIKARCHGIDTDGILMVQSVCQCALLAKATIRLARMRTEEDGRLVGRPPGRLLPQCFYWLSELVSGIPHRLNTAETDFTLFINAVINRLDMTPYTECKPN